MRKKHIASATFFTLLAFGSAQAQSDTLDVNDGFDFEVQYLGDNVHVVQGGVKRGGRYLGLANIKIGFDTEKAGWWRGTTFFANGANTHGASPSEEMLGDAQVASNIEAGGDHTFFEELWVKQSLGQFDLTVGLQDLNVEFAGSEHGALFLNSSFGILPIISGNIAAPVYPITALGATLNWHINETTSWVVALYDGKSTDFAYNPYNISWDFNKGDGNFAISEYQKSLVVNGLPGLYKIGGYLHDHTFEKSFSKDLDDSLDVSVAAVYMYADQKVWQRGKRNIGVFAQMGYSPSPSSLCDFYIGLGSCMNGVFSKKNNDILGVSMAYENFNDQMGSETTFELTYRTSVTNNIFIQPDFQYIVDPSGRLENIDNCAVATIRFGLNF